MASWRDRPQAPEEVSRVGFRNTESLTSTFPQISLPGQPPMRVSATIHYSNTRLMPDGTFCGDIQFRSALPFVIGNADLQNTKTMRNGGRKHVSNWQPRMDLGFTAHFQVMPFLRFPAEVRDMIYEYVFEDQLNHVGIEINKAGKGRGRKIAGAGLLRVNRQVNTEAVRFLYSRSRFNFPSLDVMRTFLGQISVPAGLALRKLSVMVKSKPTAKVVAATVELLRQRTHILRSLTIECYLLTEFATWLDDPDRGRTLEPWMQLMAWRCANSQAGLNALRLSLLGPIDMADPEGRTFLRNRYAARLALLN